MKDNPNFSSLLHGGEDKHKRQTKRYGTGKEIITLGEG